MQRPFPFAQGDDKSGRSAFAPQFGSVMVTGAQTTVQHDPTDERHSPWHTATCTEPAEFNARDGRAYRAPWCGAGAHCTRTRPSYKGKRGETGERSRRRGCRRPPPPPRSSQKRPHHRYQHKTSRASAVIHSATISLRPSDQKPLYCSQTRTCLRERVRKKTTCVPSQ